MKKIVKTYATPKEIQVARNYYQDDDTEIDDSNVLTSECPEDEGRWVAAWVWVSDEMMRADELCTCDANEDSIETCERHKE